MPIYQYKCQKCFTINEVLQGINDPPLAECASCQGPVKKIIAPAGIIFKGSGFHINDYRGGEGSAIGSSDKSDAKDTSSSKDKESKSTDSKGGGSTATSANKETTTSKGTSDSAAA